ncbi:MAG: FtsX-like permease family protein, partial [Proteobacteria bacterium]|nr:FtsX-like permease family protein [Pseudomonadota bacterium]
GEQVDLREGQWTVVGHFEAGGSAMESEIWIDLKLAQAIFRRGGSMSLARVRMDDASVVDELKTRIDDDPRLELALTTEEEFYSAQSASRTRIINTFGFVVAGIMAVGAVFAALNTMYTAVSTRSVEIATLRALGFGGLPVVVSVMMESLFLALLGGVIGGVLVFLVFDGYTASTLNNASFSQVAFDFAVTPDLLQMGLAWAVGLGLVGGLFPAVRSARMPITAALRGD